VFAKLLVENKSPLLIKEELGFTLINDEDAILNIIRRVLNENPTLIDDFKAGKTRVQGFIMGQVMKETKGKVNPGVANKLILQELNK
jgi:aspartyl-tRNA(Asn)/glutamyl-tRNA(Gln) amidotransferase subunit B